MLLALSPLAPHVEAGVWAVLEKPGDPAWVGAYLLDSPRESARPLTTLARGARISVEPARTDGGYLFAELPAADGKPARTGWVHRKFLRLPSDGQAPAATAAPSSVAPEAARPEPKDGQTAAARIEQLEARIKALEARNAELTSRLTTLERTGVTDPGADFLLRLQKLEMEVRSRDTSSLPTIPFPDVHKPAEPLREPQQPQPAQVPGMSWVLRGW